MAELNDLASKSKLKFSPSSNKKLSEQVSAKAAQQRVTKINKWPNNCLKLATANERQFIGKSSAASAANQIYLGSQNQIRSDQIDAE